MTRRPSHPTGGRRATVTGVRRTLYNPGPDAVIYDQAGHQADPGHFQGESADDVTQGHIAAGRLLDQGPAANNESDGA